MTNSNLQPPIKGERAFFKMNDRFYKQLGRPDIKISGLEVWIHGRQFPDLHDYWDGNWLRVTAHCSASGASVWASGSFIHLPELSRWYFESLELYKSLKGESNLVCLEPELSVSIESGSLGQLTMRVDITPNHMVQKHKFIFELDQSYLGDFLGDCKSILDKYEIRGKS